MANSMFSPREDKDFEGFFKVDESRRQQYKFGKGDVVYVAPFNYPKEEEFKKDQVYGELVLEHIYGYKGNTSNARQNLYHRDGLLLYYNAAVGIVLDPKTKQQLFFTEHNDDITAMCIDPREGSTLVATGQKDPKDDPTTGKEHPKVWIWDYKTMKGVCCIDDVCWGFISRMQWSPITGYLYVLCGDKDQTLKTYDIDAIRKGKSKVVLSKDVELLAVNSQNTKKLGFLIRPKQCEEVGIKDEIIFHCANKLQHVQISEDPKKKLGRLQAKFRAISVGNLNKKGESAFICASYLQSGKYVVGASSGMIYLCDGAKAINVAKAHKDAIFALTVSKDNKIYSGGSGKDKTIRIFDIIEEEKGDCLKELYNSGNIHIDGSDFEFQPKEMIIHDDPNNVNNKFVYVSSKTNQIINYDIENRRGSLLIDGHDGQIHGVATHPNKDIFITIGWDSCVKIWNAKSHKCLSTYQFAKGGDPWVWQRKQEEENGEDNKNNDEERKKSIVDDWNMNAISWSSNGSLIAIGTESSAIAIFEYATEPTIQLNLIKVFQIPKRNPNNEVIESVSKLRFNKESSMLAIAHQDGNLYVFALNDGGKKCAKWTPYTSRAAPSHLQWSEDSQMIRIFTRDYEVTYLKLDSKTKALKRCQKIPDPDNYKWFGNPLPAGWETKGCLLKGMDGTDINDVAITNHVNNDHPHYLIACGDDHGKVRLHPFPVVLSEPNKTYSGHAEHVQQVEFLGNDNYLISVGGADMSIFQWKVVKQ